MQGTQALEIFLAENLGLPCVLGIAEVDPATEWPLLSRGTKLSLLKGAASFVKCRIRGQAILQQQLGFGS